MTIDLAASGTQDLSIQSVGNTLVAQRFAPDAGAAGLGVAIDLGTTTVVCRLYDLADGELVASSARINPQITFGADVISRIEAVTNGKLDELNELITSTLSELIIHLCEQATTTELTHIYLAGNTVMQHLAAGISPESIGVAPYTPHMLFGTMFDICGLPAPVFLAPCVSGYVGGDITAGLLACDMIPEHLSQPKLLCDLGTNGEIALGGPEGIVCCATAAGPVFEGGTIRFGMPALPGAISAVSFADETGFILEVLGDQEPVGICGSGLISTVAFLLDQGIVDKTGLLRTTDPPRALAPLVGHEDGVAVFYLTADRSLYISQLDIRNVQLAKGALATGIATLLADANLTVSDPVTVYLAGGFGQALDIESAVRIGLIPQAFSHSVQPVGNSAIEGISAALLSGQARDTLEQIARHCRYKELAVTEDFDNRFLDSLSLEPWG
jgi:uncharacterized 2Fe-2S/4Fe-4S cluster protein (DUF4445 family)